MTRKEIKYEAKTFEICEDSIIFMGVEDNIGSFDIDKYKIKVDDAIFIGYCDDGITYNIVSDDKEKYLVDVTIKVNNESKTKIEKLIKLRNKL